MNLFKTKRTIDFTKGDIVKNIVLFAIPMIIGEALQNLYNTVDSLVVGKFLGPGPLAAVTVSMYVSNMIVGFFNGMSVGSNVVVAKAFGRGEKEEITKNVRVSFTFSVLLGVVLSILGIIFTPWLLKVAGSRPDYYQYALVYLRIYLAGIMFTVIYNSAAGILRAVGDSTTPFYILIVTCFLNVVLDVVLVTAIPLGIAGTALATVIAQFLSVLFAYIAISKKINSKCIDFKEMFVEGKRIVLSVVNIGTAAGMQMALIGFSNMFVVRYINLFDTLSVAGIGIAQRLDKFVFLPVKSFGLAMTTFVGQNLGAEHNERIREGLKKCLYLSIITVIFVGIFFYELAKPVSNLFSDDEYVIRISTEMMRCFIPFVLFPAIREVLLGVMRGYGYAQMPMILSLIGMVGVRQLFLMISLGIRKDIYFIYICYPIGWVATVILLVCYYFMIRKDLKGLANNEI